MHSRSDIVPDPIKNKIRLTEPDNFDFFGELEKKSQERK